jgi:tetratricopeptide (TPR) repeat protein
MVQLFYIQHEAPDCSFAKMPMSFLKRLVGRETGGDADTDPLGTRFDEEWYRVVRRFAIVSGYGVAGFEFNLRHPETREIMPPHLGIAPYFEDWKQIRTPWDRMDLFFRLILDTRGIQNFHPWAVANVMTACRRVEQAYQILRGVELTGAGTKYYARHCGSFARVLIPLNQPKEALQWAQTAAAADPEDPRLQLLLADALRFNGRCEEATAIYSGLMATAAPAPDEAPDPISDVFSRLFALETGAVPSPFFALDFVGSLEDPEQAAQFWKLAEAEFYDSPHFRMRHAYHLAAVGQTREAFAKLAALVSEMPWLREAQINLLQLFKHLDPDGGKVMPDLRRQVEAKIREEGWTTEDMRMIEIQTGA